MANYVMGYWDCKSCGASVKGTEKFCSKCGQAKAADVKYYMKEKEALSEEEAAKLNTNPDWLCEFCGTYNSDSETNCTSCGAGRGSKNSDYFDINKDRERIHEKDTTRWECSSCHVLNEAETESCVNCGAPKSDAVKPEEKKEPVAQNVKPAAKSHKKLGLILGIAGVALLAILVVMLMPKVKTLKVENFRWATTVTVEELLTYQEDDWSVPDGGRIYDEKTEHYADDPIYEERTREVTTEEIVGYDTSTEYRDTGSGVFESYEVSTPIYGPVTRTETYQEIVGYTPVYKTKYYYEIDRWTYDCEYKEEGNDQSPYYTEVTLGENERQSESAEYYVTMGTGEDDSVEYAIEYENWLAMEKGGTYKVKIESGDTITEIIVE